MKRILRLVDKDFNEELDAATESVECMEDCNEKMAKKAGYDAAFIDLHKIIAMKSDVATWKGLAIMSVTEPVIPEGFGITKAHYIDGYHKAVCEVILNFM